MITIDNLHTELRECSIAVTRIVLSMLTARHFKFRSSCVRLTCDFACTLIQVDALVRVILPEASIHPTAISSSGEHPRMRHPVLAPAHDAGLGQAAQLATVMAALEAQQAEIEKQQAEIKKQQAEIEAGKLDNKKLREKVGVTTCCVARRTSWSNSACFVRCACPAPTVHRAIRRARRFNKHSLHRCIFGSAGHLYFLHVFLCPRWRSTSQSLRRARAARWMPVRVVAATVRLSITQN